MAQIHPYLNFNGNTEEAFNFYKSVFGGEFKMVQRFADIPGSDQMPEGDQQKIMHICLSIGHTDLMATDALESQGHTLVEGINVSLSLNAESKEEADRLFNALSAGGVVGMALEDTFWGAYFGMFHRDVVNVLPVSWFVEFEVWVGQLLYFVFHQRRVYVNMSSIQRQIHSKGSLLYLDYLLRIIHSFLCSIFESPHFPIQNLEKLNPENLLCRFRR